MFVKFQGQITQLTQYLCHILQDGPDLSALCIVEAKLTILLHSLPVHRLLPFLFSPHQAETLLLIASRSTSPAHPHPIRESSSSHFSLGECSRLRFKVSEDTHSFKELSLLSCQILESLEQWMILAGRSRTIQKQIQLTESDGLLLNRYQEHEGSIDSIHKVIHEVATESLSSEESLLDRLSGDQAVNFLQYLVRWSSQLQREIGDFKTALKPYKDDISVDFTRPSEAFVQSKTKYLDKVKPTQQKKARKMGAMSFECAKKEKKVKKLRQGCPQLCAIY